MRILILAAFALILTFPAHAAWTTPGQTCAREGDLANSNGFLTCLSGVWVVNPIVAANLAIGTNVPLVSVDLSNKTDALALPVGTTGARPAAGYLVNGEIRYNSTLGVIEAYVNGTWVNLLSSASGAGDAIPASGTEGAVQFNAGGALSADSGFVWDNANKRLGIGTAVPTTLLDLGAFNGTASNTLHIAAGAGYDAALKLMETSDNYGFTIKNSNSGTGLTGLNILRHSNSAAGTSALYINRDTGYVGVGTTTPSSKFQVANGEVQPGSSGASCSSSNAGALRWTGSAMQYCDGSTWTALATGGRADCSPTDVQTFAASGTWTKPTCGTMVSIYCVGGGGSGATLALNTYRGASGGGGGGGGKLIIGRSFLADTESVTIGKGGAAVSTANSAGNAGGDSKFGSWVVASGGSAGQNVVGASVAASGGGISVPSDGYINSFGSAGGQASAGAVVKCKSGSNVLAAIPGCSAASSSYGGGAGGGWGSGKYDSSGSCSEGFTGSTTYTPCDGGVSTYAGSGGNGVISGSGTSGTFPGGGGGGGVTGGGAGADGQCVVMTW